MLFAESCCLMLSTLMLATRDTFQIKLEARERYKGRNEMP